MITIIFAPPRTGKTCFLTHIANTAAFDRERNTAMRREILLKRQSGFGGLQTIPPHCVSANYDIVMRKFGYSPRLSRRINPFRLGYANDFVQTHFNLPYECICITEAQKYLNSRMSMYFPDWQSRWYEQHGHNNLDIWLDTQRPLLIDVNVRELSQFIEIMGLKLKHDGFGRVRSLTWTIRRIDNSGLFDRYSPEKERLHFHGVFYIPDGEMLGKITEKKSYSPQEGRMKTRYENSFFQEAFGVNDFQEVSEMTVKHGHAFEYILKYMEKQGERIVYSRGIATEICKKMDNRAIITAFTDYVEKFVLFDDVISWETDIMRYKPKQMTMIDLICNPPLTA